MNRQCLPELKQKYSMTPNGSSECEISRYSALWRDIKFEILRILGVINFNFLNSRQLNYNSQVLGSGLAKIFRDGWSFLGESKLLKNLDSIFT